MVTLHITQFVHYDTSELWGEIMHWSYYFMCFFFFKAGYFNKSVGGKTVPYIIDKSKRLLVPYFSWAFIGAAVYFTFFFFFLNDRNPFVKQVNIEHLWDTAAVYGNGPLWFLMSFFAMYVLMHFIEKVRHLHWVILIFPVISYWLYTKGNPLPLSLDNVFMGTFFFFLGHLWHETLDELGKKGGIALSLFLTIAFILINSYFNLYYQMSDNKWTGDATLLTIAVSFALCGISGLLILLNVKRIPILCYIGQHSMVFFVGHMPILMFYLMSRSACMRTVRGHTDDYLTMILLAFSICFWIVPYVEKVPWLSGRWPKKKKEEEMK